MIPLHIKCVLKFKNVINFIVQRLSVILVHLISFGDIYSTNRPTECTPLQKQYDCAKHQAQTHTGELIDYCVSIHLSFCYLATSA